MKKTIYLLILPIFVFLSCSQENITDLKTADLSFFKEEVNQRAFENALKDRFNFDEKSNIRTVAKGAKFIEPFYASEGFGVTWFNFPYIGYAIFQTELGKSDFYRENNDGTISVHINSNNAFAIYREFSLFDEEDQYTLIGEKGHLSVNFTANFVMEDIYDPETGEYLFTAEYFDFDNSDRGVTIHGNANVVNEDTGEKHTFLMKWLNTPSGSKGGIEISLK